MPLAPDARDIKAAVTAGGVEVPRGGIELDRNAAVDPSARNSVGPQ